MKRYLLIKGKYESFAVPYESSQQLGALVGTLADCAFVESKGYGDDQRYIPTSEGPMAMEFVDAARFTVGDEVQTLKARLDEVTKQQNSYAGYWTKEMEKTKKLEAEIAELKKRPAPAPTLEELMAADPL